MNTKEEAIYILRRIDNHDALNDALCIYNESELDISISTNTNDIKYWFDHRNDDQDYEFIPFGLYLNDKLIGYAQTVYFAVHKLIFIDYIVISQAYRGRSFYEFCYEIMDYYRRNDYYYQYALTELPSIECQRGDTKDSMYGKALMRLIEHIGFQEIDINYIQPPLGYNNPLSIVDSRLAILIKDSSRASIKALIIYELIDTVFFEHYARWYKPFFTEKQYAEYMGILRSLLEKIKTYPNNAQIKLTGKSFFERNPPPPPPLPKKFPIVISFIAFTLLMVVLSLYYLKYFGEEHQPDMWFVFFTPLVCAFVFYVFISLLVKDITVYNTIKYIIRVISEKLPK